MYSMLTPAKSHRTSCDRKQVFRQAVTLIPMNACKGVTPWAPLLAGLTSIAEEGAHRGTPYMCSSGCSATKRNERAQPFIAQVKSQPDHHAEIDREQNMSE